MRRAALPFGVMPTIGIIGTLYEMPAIIGITLRDGRGPLPSPVVIEVRVVIDCRGRPSQHLVSLGDGIEDFVQFEQPLRVEGRQPALPQIDRRSGGRPWRVS